jgi:hypothetical protein
MAGLLDDDYGAGGIAAGMKGFLQGLQQMREYNLQKENMDENRKFREMEINSRREVEDRRMQEQAEDKKYREAKDQEDRAAREAKMSLEGNQSGYKYDPATKTYVFVQDLWNRALQMRKAQAEASFSDPYNIKGMQAEKLKREEQQAEAGLKLPPDKVLLVQQGAQIPNQLADLDVTLKNNEKLFGPGVGRVGAANPYDTQAQTIDAQMRASAQAFGRYMEGGVLRKEDEDKYRKMFPQLTDTPEVARNKLAIVNRLLTQKQNADVSALKSQGYDVRAFGMLPEGKLPDGLINTLPDQGAVNNRQLPVITPPTKLGGSWDDSKEARLRALEAKAAKGGRVANGSK